MGEVYQATDTKLGRSVAVKVLPDAFARDAERLSRFEREAKVLASLNHSNIAALYGMEEAEGRHFLVMELVPGETLAERLQRGLIPIDEVLKIAHQIAEGVEAAHDKGVIHRDLKPANVKITPEEKVKVLDFGLAKALDTTPEPKDIMNSPTLLSAPTNPGIILGTAGYMSPEQAKGEAADHRSDIFSFGCVLYEMLTGRQTFHANTVTETIAAVLMREPDLKALPANLNPKLEDLIRRCLAKNRKDRWHAIADVRVEIAAIMSDPHGLKSAHIVRRPVWKLAVVFAAGVVAAVLVTAAVVSNMKSPQSLSLTRFAVVLPEGQRFTNQGRQLVTISPDGSSIVYSAGRQLHLRNMAQMQDQVIQGTTGDRGNTNPFFSPDGRWIGFFSLNENKVKKVAITGGASVTICDADNLFGASWTSADVLFLGQGPKGILRVSANGGKPETVVEVKPGESAHGPHLLPDGDSLLFTLSKAAGLERWDKAEIVVQSLKTGERRTLLERGSDARYLPTGHIVYALGANILAVPFDAKNLRIAGGPIPMVEGVMRSINNATATAHFEVSANGSMVYVPGTGPFSLESQLVMAGRDGNRKPLNVPSGPYSFPRFSPYGKQLVLQSNDGQEAFVSIYDLDGSAPLRRLTFGGQNFWAIWTRDGQRIVFRSERDGEAGLFSQRADGSGSAERLVKFDSGFNFQPASWSPDGQVLIFDYRTNNGSAGVAMLPAGSDAKPVQLVGPPAGNASLSADGRWLAYSSAERGQNEVYVQPFPVTGAKYQITTTGGQDPVWSPDGKQLFYLSANRQIMAVDVQTQPSFSNGKTTPLPIENIIDPGPRSYDISPDGKSFIVMLPRSDADSNKYPSEQINVTLNWLEELKQRVPVR
jgi:serine/threonine-protein kinase